MSHHVHIYTCTLVFLLLYCVFQSVVRVYSVQQDAFESSEESEESADSADEGGRLVRR